MQIIEAEIVLTIEVNRGDAASVLKDITEHLDGFQPAGGEADYTITESRTRNAKKRDG